MSMLNDKRQFVIEKIAQLQANRVNEIQAKVDAYKRQLEAEPESEEILKLKEVLKAIDAIIVYDNENMNTVSAGQIAVEEIAQPIGNVQKTEEIKVESTCSVNTEVVSEPVENLIENTVESKEVENQVVSNTEAIENTEVVEEIKVAQPSESRPGMAYVGIPERR